MIHYREASPGDMRAVAVLHIACFKGTFIAYWGETLIERYYQEFINEEAPFVLAFDDEKLIGFCMGYYEGSNARTMFLKKNKIRLALRMLVLCLSFNKLVLTKCWQFLSGSKKGSKGQVEVKAEADLLSICVLNDYRGQGISKELVNKFEEHVIRANKKNLILAVYQNNDRAIAFYKKMGYCVAGEDGDEYKMYKMLK